MKPRPPRPGQLKPTNAGRTWLGLLPCVAALNFKTKQIVADFVLSQSGSTTTCPPRVHSLTGQTPRNRTAVQKCVKFLRAQEDWNMEKAIDPFGGAAYGQACNTRQRRASLETHLPQPSCKWGSCPTRARRRQTTLAPPPQHGSTSTSLGSVLWPGLDVLMDQNTAF